MELMSNLADGFAVALTWQNLALALMGCFLGTIMGALPGLGPSNGVAILIPLAFTMGLGATPSLILLTSVYYGAMYGGRISSILLNIPGDEPAMMTCLDGYPMAQQGRAGEALALSGIASFVGAFFATCGLVLLAPQLVKVALLLARQSTSRSLRWPSRPSGEFPRPTRRSPRSRRPSGSASR